jgi:hypothetical protein
MDGMDGEHATIAHCICSQSLSTLVANVTSFESSTSRKSMFHDLIGYNAPTETSHTFYLLYKVAILYEEYDGTVDLNHIFRHPVLLRVCCHLMLSDPLGPTNWYLRSSRASFVDRMAPRGCLKVRPSGPRLNVWKSFTTSHVLPWA